MSGFEITEAGDMKSIKFTVPGNPFGKQRPKFARMGTYTKTYTPKETTQHSYRRYRLQRRRNRKHLHRFLKSSPNQRQRSRDTRLHSGARVRWSRLRL